MLRNQRFCSFVSFLIVSLTPFIYKPPSWRDLTTFIISFFSSSEIINAAPDQKIFFWIKAGVTDVRAVNTKGTKTLLPKNMKTFVINGRPIFIKGQRNFNNRPF